MMDQKIEHLEKQNLESRIFVLGGYKPNQFFNCHPRVYEKAVINTNFNAQAIAQQNEKLISNTQMMAPIKPNQKQLSSNSSNDQGNLSTNDPSSRSFIDNPHLKKSNSGAYGKKKQSTAQGG